ncbi:sigma 54-interacting transcriptional regulator [Bacillus sp. Sa1BUA2]|uniref:Sigma 54-interacting transcriptional regulator n=1 Tax=Bacillus norwichensis TaxID=2762217 RepID=A0ABR8VLG9_9BACI|nr:sigma 54-interacting transcriptional regulator [Bacillus norwichensis]
MILYFTRRFLCKCKFGGGVLLEQLKYIDGISIVDTKGTILFTIKFNPKFHSEIDENAGIIGQNLFSVFPMINETSSTLFQAMRSGTPIFRASQSIVDFNGNKNKTTNISLPIKANGKIIGAIELSKDISVTGQLSTSVVEIDPNSFRVKHLKEKVKPERAFFTLDDIITENEEVLSIKRSVKNMAQGDSPVIIYGETGTGKELFAHAIHNASDRRSKPFITQNCAALPETLIESILFGTKRGGFTGAENNPGLFELADGGTLFLDEINSMPIHLQAKLLRVLEEGYVRRIGDSHLRSVDVRLITATNIHPVQCIKEGILRQDLYYRIGVMMVAIPPLRERKEDIRVLIDYFIGKFNKKLSKKIAHISKDALISLHNHDWPGNIRELENIIEYAMNQVDVCEDTLQVKHMEQQMKLLGLVKSDSEKEMLPLKEEIATLEKERIKEAIVLTEGNVSRAARLLDIPRQTFQAKMKQYKITI